MHSHFPSPGKTIAQDLSSGIEVHPSASQEEVNATRAYRASGTIHPQGKAMSSVSSRRALPACNPTPRISDDLRFNEYRKARIPDASLAATCLPALTSNATHFPSCSRTQAAL